MTDRRTIRLLAGAATLALILGLLLGLAPIGLSGGDFETVSCGSGFMPNDTIRSTGSLNSTFNARATCQGKVGTRRALAMAGFVLTSVLATAMIVVWRETSPRFRDATAPAAAPAND